MVKTPPYQKRDKCGHFMPSLTLMVLALAVEPSVKVKTSDLNGYPDIRVPEP